MIERHLEVKLPTIWTDGRGEVGRGRDEKESEEKEPDKSGYGTLFEVEVMKSANALSRKAHVEVKRHEAHHCRGTFWKLRCWKSVDFCGAKHISKWKVLKTSSLGPSFKVDTSKKARACGEKRISKRKSVKNWRSRNTFGSCMRCWKSARRCGAKRISKSKVLRKWRSRTTFEGWDVEKAHAAWKVLEAWRSWATFWTWDVEKVNAVGAKKVASSTNWRFRAIFLQ